MRERELVALHVQRHDPGLGRVRDDPFGNAHERKVSWRRVGRSPSRYLAWSGRSRSRSSPSSSSPFSPAARSCRGSPSAPKVRWLALAALLALVALWAVARPRASCCDRLLGARRRSRRACARVGRLVRGAATTVAALGLTPSSSSRSLLALRRAGRPDGRRGRAVGIVGGGRRRLVGGLLVLVFRYDRAVQAATTVSPARYQGLGGGPNLATMVLAVAIPLAAYFTLFARTRVLRAGAAAVALAGVLASIAFSGSRGALAAAFTGLFVFALAGFPSRRRAVPQQRPSSSSSPSRSRSSRSRRAPRRTRPNPTRRRSVPTGRDSRTALHRRDNVSGVRLQDDIGHPGRACRRTTGGRCWARAGGSRPGGARSSRHPSARRSGTASVPRTRCSWTATSSSTRTCPRTPSSGSCSSSASLGLAASRRCARRARRARRAGPRLDARGAHSPPPARRRRGGLTLAVLQSFVYAPGNVATLASGSARSCCSRSRVTSRA